MARYSPGQESNTPDNMQDVGVRSVLSERAGAVPREARDWRLSLRAVRIHNRHVQAAKPDRPACRCLREGLAGFNTPAQVGLREGDPVVESDRVDGGEGATPPSGGERPGRETPVLRS